MILNEFLKIYESQQDLRNAEEILGDPFEYLIRNIYENQMIIADMGMQIMAEEYSYLKEYGEEPVLIGEGGIISTIFGGLFKLLGNAFKAICNFFKSIFSRNKSTIESTKDVDKKDDKSEENTKNRTAPNSQPTASKSSSTFKATNVSARPIVITNTDNSKTKLKDSKPTPSQKQTTSAPKKPIDNRNIIFNKIIMDAAKNPDKYGLDHDVYIIDPDAAGKSVLTFANQYADNIIHCVDDMSEDLRIRYEEVIASFDPRLDTYDYPHIDPKANEYRKTHSDPIEQFKQSERMRNDRTVLHYNDWFKKHVTEMMLSKIPDYVKQSDAKEMYHQFTIDKCCIKIDHARLYQIFVGHSEYIKVVKIADSDMRADSQQSIDINTKPLYKLNEQCEVIFNNAKSVIQKAEKDLKSIQQLASGAENEINRMCKPNNGATPASIVGKRGEEAKPVYINYFKALNSSVTYLITTATTTNSQVASAFAKLISHCISLNTSACRTLAKFVKDVNHEAFKAFWTSGSVLEL